MKKLLMVVMMGSLAALAGCAAEEPYETEVAEVDEGVYEEPYDVDYDYDWGVWDTWDVDRDDYLTEDEFYTGYDQVGLYDAWDVDRDTYLDENELGTWETYGYDYTDYDVDTTGTIDRDEFQKMSFAEFDLDDDGRISRDEWTQAKDRMQTTGGMGTGQMGGEMGQTGGQMGQGQTGQTGTTNPS